MAPEQIKSLALDHEILQYILGVSFDSYYLLFLRSWHFEGSYHPGHSPLILVWFADSLPKRVVPREKITLQACPVLGWTSTQPHHSPDVILLA